MEAWGSWLVERMSNLTVVSVVFKSVLAYILWAIADRWVLHRGRKGPVHWPILGATVEVLRNYHQLNDWTVFYFLRDGLTFGCKTANANFIFTADPANVEYILKTKFANHPKGKVFHENFDIFLGDGIFNVDGESWKQQRKTASFEFASRKLRDFSTVVYRDYSVKVAFIITSASMTLQPLDVQDLFLRLALDSSFQINFGYEIDSLKPELPDLPFAKAFDFTNEVTSKRFVNPFWKLQRILNVGNEAAVVTSVKEMNDFIYNIIEVRKSELLVNTKVHPHVGDKIFQELLALDTEIQAVNIDSKSEPETLGGEDDFNQRILRFSQLLTSDSLLKLHYLHACILETLRLYPAVPMGGKCVAEDDILPDGTAVKKGNMVMYSPYAMGRMPALWGQEATKFKPERWLVNGVVQPQSPFKFTAFQAGPRICLGKDSAMLQLRMTLALLCRFFKFELEASCVVKYRQMSTLLLANGLHVKIAKYCDK